MIDGKGKVPYTGKGVIDGKDKVPDTGKGVMISVLVICGVLIVALVLLFALALIDWSGERGATDDATAPAGNATEVVGDFLAGQGRSTNPADWITSDDYPAEALREELEGRVTFELEVSASGWPTRCTIARSSGARVLDDATCHAVMRSARFVPRRDSEGKAMPFRMSQSVWWKMPN